FPAGRAVDRVGMNGANEPARRIESPVTSNIESSAAATLNYFFRRALRQVRVSLNVNLLFVAGVILLDCRFHRLAPVSSSLDVSLAIQAPKGPRVTCLMTPSSSPLSIQIPPQLRQRSRTNP